MDNPNRLKKTRRSSTALRRMQSYIKLTGLEPPVMRLIGEEAKRNGTDKLTLRQINQIIRETRAAR